MKILLVSFIIIVSGYIGYQYKMKFFKQLKTINDLKEYCIYFKDNLVLFKNNICEININYINMHKNKNANNVLFIKNNMCLNQINLKYLQNTIYNHGLYSEIQTYFLSQGKGEYEHEVFKINELLDILNRELICTKDDLKQKGDLYFKLILAIGAVISILIWWCNGCFDFV